MLTTGFGVAAWPDLLASWRPDLFREPRPMGEPLIIGSFLPVVVIDEDGLSWGPSSRAICFGIVEGLTAGVLNPEGCAVFDFRHHGNASFDDQTWVVRDGPHNGN